jgi:hypothetical protein
MNNDLLTVKEVSEITGFSKQSIYQQLEKNLKKYVVLVENKTRLSSLVITEYYGLDLKSIEKALNRAENNSINRFKNSQSKSTEIKRVFKLKSTYSSNKKDSQKPENKEIVYFQELVKELQNDLRVERDNIKDKDLYIKELTTTITDLTERLAILFENSQQLQQNQQLLEAKNVVDDIEEKEPKKSFFQRLFRK